MNPPFSIGDLSYDLPDGLIAQEPLPRREDARLLLVDRAANRILDSSVARLPELLNANDLVVVNNTRVLPARFLAKRRTGGRVPGLFLREVRTGEWIVLLRGSRRLDIGDTVSVRDSAGENVQLELIDSLGDGQWRVAVDTSESAERTLDRIGKAPLPPYIRRNQDADARDAIDRGRYQTVYADKAGSVAAPTAGLHLTEDLMQQMRAKGIKVAEVTLHVGLGTFKPIKADSVESHWMHTEAFTISNAAAAAINTCKQNGGRVLAVGTTSVRVMETVAVESAKRSTVKALSGDTNLFIYPPFDFEIVDGLITNFHLPNSTLLALVMALGGVELVKRAYRHAVQQGYRFYSYGDAMMMI